MAVNPTNDAASTTGAPAHTASKGSGGRGERRERRDDREKEKSPYTERVVFINRVSKVVQNIVHGSDSPESAAREIAIFFEGK